MDIHEFAKLGGQSRWKGKTDEEKRDHALRMVRARNNKQASGDKTGDKHVSIEGQPVDEIRYIPFDVDNQESLG